ncbi:MAG: hypothetical protein GX053_10480 [Tissierella sp.]|nr:hypothetical protein [Tissierella sp.]
MRYVIIVFIIIAIVDLSPFSKKDKRKDFYITLMIMMIALALSSLYALDIKIPSPVVGLDNFIRNVLKIAYK